MKNQQRISAYNNVHTFAMAAIMQVGDGYYDHERPQSEDWQDGYLTALWRIVDECKEHIQELGGADE